MRQWLKVSDYRVTMRLQLSFYNGIIIFLTIFIKCLSLEYLRMQLFFLHKSMRTLFWNCKMIRMFLYLFLNGINSVKGNSQ